jgi:hypothetical protein
MLEAIDYLVFNYNYYELPLNFFKNFIFINLYLEERNCMFKVISFYYFSI